MAATGTPTPNIGLRCPVGTDPASVDDINYNSGVIDTKLGAVGSTSVQAQIDALNRKIEKYTGDGISTNSLLADVVASTGLNVWKMSGGSYTGNDLPPSSVSTGATYSVALSLSRENAKFVLFIDRGCSVFVNAYINNVWIGWSQMQKVS